MAKGGHGKESTTGIKAAWRQFDEGDKVVARRLAEAVLASQASEAEKKEAAELIDRLDLPKKVYQLIGAAAGAILLMVILALARH